MSTASSPGGRLSGPLGLRVRAQRPALLAVLDRYGVSHPRVFGSVARGDDSADSDVDLLVDLAAGTSLFDVLRMQDELEAILDVRVDVVSSTALKSGARARVHRDVVDL